MDAPDLHALLGWVWARHHHPASWYLRPLALIAFGVAAWQRRPLGLLLALLLFPATLLLFPAPAGAPDPAIAAYLDAERRLLGGSAAAALGLALAAAAFLGLLGFACWRRSGLAGLAVLHLGTLAKLLWGLVVWGEAGEAVLRPALFTLLVCDLLVAAWWWRRRARPHGVRP